MNATSDEARRLFPHEICFGLFLAVTWVRLVIARGVWDGHAVVWFVALLLNVWLVARCWRDATPLNWRLRLLFYPVAMNVTYLLMRNAVPKIHPASADLTLLRMENLLFGSTLSLQLQPLVHPVLTEILSSCYFLFFPFLTLSLLYYSFGNLEVLKKFCTGLFTVYGLGFIGYTLLPGQAPWRAMAADFHVPLTGWWMTRVNDLVVRQGSNGVDAFPSLHCGVSTFLLIFDWWHRRWRFWLYLLPCIGLWIATVYLRYHYGIDCLAGFALAAFGLWLVRAERAAQKSGTQPCMPHSIWAK